MDTMLIVDDNEIDRNIIANYFAEDFMILEAQSGEECFRILKEYKYNIDIVKLGYKRVCKTLLPFDSLIVAILFTSTKMIDNIYIRLLVAFILVFPLFAGVYHLIAMYYKKESER